MKPVFRKPFFFILTALAMMFSSFGVTPAYAATLTVTTAADNTITDGNCSLREAILNANNNNGAFPDCFVGSGADTITFDSALSGAIITLSSALTISDDLTIDGSALASQITISGDNNVRVFTIDPSIFVTLDSLRIIQGKAALGGGGGIFNHGSLTVRNSIFMDNSSTDLQSGGGGAITNTNGSLTVLNSRFYLNVSVTAGGAIWSDVAMIVTDSSFYENSAGTNGGAISTGGQLLTSVNNSTFSNNGAVAGGGISNSGSILKVTNSTFYNNGANSFGGGIFNIGIVTFTNSTISDNNVILGVGGGIYNSGTLNFANTIVANSPSGGDCLVTGGGSIGTNTNNLVEDGSCSALFVGDPVLGYLADNGGPTQTMALLVGSPAINAGDDNVCFLAPVFNLDQRGVTRPQGAHCDIGAYEIMGQAFRSNGSQDGWILKFRPIYPPPPGTKNSNDTTIIVGDDQMNQEYRAILSFDTSSLPANAKIIDVTLRVRVQGVTGTVNTLGGIKVDIRSGVFGTSPNLQLADFQNAADVTDVLGSFAPRPSGWYRAILNETAYSSVNLTGTTQFRLYFYSGTDSDGVEDNVSIFSGDAAAANRPQLIVQYYIP